MSYEPHRRQLSQGAITPMACLEGYCVPKTGLWPRDGPTSSCHHTCLSPTLASEAETLAGWKGLVCRRLD